MTYSELELLKSVFKSDGKFYFAGGKKIQGRPSSADYARHLNGEAVLELTTGSARFAIGRVLSGDVPKGSPLVELRNGPDRYAAVFFKQSIDGGAAQLRRVAKWFRLSLAVLETLELPFFNDSLSFVPLDEECAPFRLPEKALEFCGKKAVSVYDIDEWEKGLPYSDAPFCVQTEYLVTGRLPDWAAPYLDAKGLPIEDAERAEWWRKNTAPYSCGGKCCDKAVCLSRRYGLGRGEVSELEFGGLVQHKDDPVFYVWSINGEEVRFDSEADLMRQERFLSQCLRKIGMVPHRMTNERWLQILNKALSGMKVVGGNGKPALSLDRAREIITKDLRPRTLVSAYYEHERLMQGWIYLDPTSSTLVVEPQSLASYITGKYDDLRIGGAREFLEVLRHLGFRGKNRSIDGINRNLWYVRSEYMFDSRVEWKDYMLSVSSGTAWESNFKAFLDEPVGKEDELSDEIKDAIDADAALYLDTEKEDL